MTIKKTVLALAMLIAFPSAQAQLAVPETTSSAADPAANRTYAQALVERTLARHPELLDIELQATPPGSPDSIIIAGKRPSRIGRKTKPVDYEVFRTGIGFVEINTTGDQNVEVQIPLLDAKNKIVGSVEVKFPYPAGSGLDKQALTKAAEIIRDELGKQIPNLAGLFVPAATSPVSSEGALGETARPIVKIVEEQEDKEALGNKQSLPMTKEVVSRAALENSSQDGYSEAVKNQAGVAPTNSKGSPNDSIKMRGISLNLFSNYRLNGGLATAGVITTPTEDKERLESLKGANALMFGVASPAGIINLVTKRATPKDIATLVVAGNSFGQYGAHLDLGRRFGEARSAGLRFNVAAVHLENGVRGADGKGQFASVGADWRATDRLSFNGDLEYYIRDVVEQGTISLLPAVNGVVPIPRVPDPRNLLSGKWAIYTPRTKNDQERFDYQLTDNWKVLGEVGRSESRRSRYTVRIGNYDINTGKNGIATITAITQKYLNKFERSELIGKFGTGPLTHDLTLGVSLSQRDADTPRTASVNSPQRQDLYNPVELPAPIFPICVSTATRACSLALQSSRDTAAYTYDTIGISPRLKVLVGLRFTRTTQDNPKTHSSAKVRSPAAGILYDILPTTTLFASYMKGLEDGGVAPINSANPFEILPPGISTQKEIGIRDSYFRGLSISASYFEIERPNAVTNSTTRIFQNDGTISYRGAEAVVAYDVNRQWTINTAVQYLRAKQESVFDPLIKGLTPENTPKLIGNVSITHRSPWVQGLTFTTGASYVAKRFVNPQDQGTIPGYTLYSAGVGYATRISGHRTSFQMNVDNLANKRYWNSVQTGTFGTGMDRSFKLNAKIDL